MDDTAKTGPKVTLTKLDPSVPLLYVTGPAGLAIRAGTVFNGRRFPADTWVPIAAGALEPGADYGVAFGADGLGVEKLAVAAPLQNYLGGFHYAPGGNAPARSGGDAVPAINPYSLWDANFRPSCPDPRGMTLVTAPAGAFWCDIYLTGANHLDDGTSKFGVQIADADDPPQKPGGGRFDRFSYPIAVSVLAHHGKALLGLEEYFAAAYGVTEKTARQENPHITGLDAPRTSKFGLMQATGNVWTWGHDNDPEAPRPALFGSSWRKDGFAGSRSASLGHWPDHSHDHIGARGRCNHLQT
jgi:hypothetical protein